MLLCCCWFFINIQKSINAEFHFKAWGCLGNGKQSFSKQSNMVLLRISKLEFQELQKIFLLKSRNKWHVKKDYHLCYICPSHFLFTYIYELNQQFYFFMFIHIHTMELNAKLPTHCSTFIYRIIMKTKSFIHTMFSLYAHNYIKTY
jgi:hypothetical protein